MITIVYLDDSELALEAVKDGLEPLGFAVITHRNPLTIYAALARASRRCCCWTPTCPPSTAAPSAPWSSGT